MALFQDRLNEALILRGMTAADLSRLTGISEGSLSQYRKGAYKATQRNLETLASALRVSIPWLMGADVPMERNKPPEALSDERFTELFNGLDERDQATVLRLMQSMLDARSEQ